MNKRFPSYLSSKNSDHISRRDRRPISRRRRLFLESLEDRRLLAGQWPVVLSILRDDVSPTALSSVAYRVTFDEIVAGVDSSDFVFQTTGNLRSPAILGVANVGSGNVYVITVNTGTGDGTLRLNVQDNNSIVRASSTNKKLGGSQIGDGDFNTGQVYAIDRTAPTATNISLIGTPTATAPLIEYNVTFSENVTGVERTDLELITSGVTGAVIESVAGSGTSYVVQVATGTGEGSVQLVLKDNDSIRDLATNPLGGSGSGTQQNGPAHFVDRLPTTVVSISAVQPNPTNASLVDFTIAFSEAVLNVGLNDFKLISAGGISGAMLTNVAGTGDTITVTAATGSGDGTIQLGFVDPPSITDLAGNPMQSTSVTSPVITIDKTTPTFTHSLLDQSPTNASLVRYQLLFTEPVMGLSTSNLQAYVLNAGTPDLSGLSITSISGSGTNYVATIATGAGSGAIGLRIVNDGNFKDAAGNMPSVTGGSGPVYQIDRIAPTVTSVELEDASPTNASSLRFLITFSENIASFSHSDLVINQVGLPGSFVSTVQSVSAIQKRVVVIPGIGEGTLSIDIVPQSSAKDFAGNQIVTPANTFDAYTVDTKQPAVTSFTRLHSSPTNASAAAFQLQFSEPVLNLDVSDFELIGTYTGAAITGLSGSGSSYVVTLNTGSSDGSIAVRLPATASVTDVLGNAYNTIANSETYVVDHTSPTVISIVPLDGNPTAATTLSYQVTFSESVTGVDPADFAVAATGLSGATISNIVGSAASYVVNLARTGGEGSISLNLVDNDSIIDVASNPLGGPNVGNGNASGPQYTIGFPKLRGTVYRDFDLDGLQDQIDTPMSGFSVFIDTNSNGIFDAGEPTTTSAVDDPLTTGINETGQYLFAIAPGTHSVRLIPPTGWLHSSPLAVSSVNNTGALSSHSAWFRTPDRIYPSPDGNHIYTIDTSVAASITGYSISSGATSALPPTTLGDAANSANVSDLAFSQDGRWVVALESLNNAVKVFSRNGTTGTLTLVSTATNGLSGVASLEGPERVVVAADGLSLYVYSKTSRSLSQFSLDPITGAMSQAQSLMISGTQTLPTTALIVTPDDSQLIFTDESTDSLFVYQRNLATGEISLAQTIVGSSSDTNVFHRPTSVAITPDGRFVYVSSDAGQRINLLTRDVSSGLLTTTSTSVSPGTEVTYLAIDPSGSFLTETRQDASTIAVSSINPLTGALTLTQTQTDVNTGNGLHRVSHVAISPDGRFAFSTDPINGRWRVMNRQLGATSVTGFTSVVGAGNVTLPPFRLYNFSPQVNSFTTTAAPNSISRSYTLTFNEVVTGVDTSDFSVETVGYNGATITSVSGTGTQRTVVVNPGIGTGSLTLKLADNDSIVDIGGEPLKGVGFGTGNPNDGSFATSIRAIDTVPPTVVSTVAEDPLLSSLTSVRYVVTFSEPVSNVAAVRFSVLTNNITGSSITSVTSLGNNQYRVTVNTGTGDGTLQLRLIDADNIFDSADNLLNGVGTGSDALAADTYTIERNPQRGFAGKLYNDANRNQAFDDGEVGIANVKVYSDLNNNGIHDAGEPNVLTAADDPATTGIDESGDYTLGNFALGTYRLRAEVPTAYFASTASSATITTVITSPPISTVNLGVEPNLTSLSGTVFVDLNANGIVDAGETGFPGMTVYRDLNSNGVLDAGEPSQLTPNDDPGTTGINEAGTFVFNQLQPGNNRIRVQVPTNYIATGSAFFIGNVTSSLDTFNNVSFLLHENLTSISGVLYNDSNSNGTQDASETARSGFTVYVDLNRNGVRGSGEPFTTSAADGSYTITNVPAGNLLVRVVTGSQTAVTSPTFQAERLFVANDNSLREINPFTGSQISSFFISPVPTRGASTGGLAFDGTTVFMLDRFDNRILKINPSDGAVLSTLGPLPNAIYSGLAFVNSLLYASDNTNERILAIHPVTGAVVSTFNIASLNAGSNFHPGPIDLLDGLGESADGTRLLAATASQKRLIINPATGIVEGAYTDLAGEQDNGIAGGTGRIFIGRRDSSSIQIYNSAGTLTSTLSTISFPNDLAAWATTAPGANLSVSLDEQVTGVNFGIESTVGTVSGHQFVDANGNGSFDASELPLAGVTVYVDANNNRLFDTGERSAVSAADGSYTLTQVPRGTPVVRTISLPGYESTALRSSTAQLYGARKRLSGLSDVNVALLDPQTGAQIGGFGTYPGLTVNDLSSIGFDGDRFYYVDNANDKLIQTSITGQVLAEAPLPGISGAQYALGVAVIGGAIYVPASGGRMPFQLWRYDPLTNQFVSPIPISTNTNQSPNLTFLPTLSTTVSESPDGRSILLFSSEVNSPRVFVLDPLTGRITTVFDLPESFGGDFAAAVLGGELFLRAERTSSSLQVYDSNFVLKRTLASASHAGLASAVVRDLGTTVTLASLSVSNVNVPHRSITTVSGRVSVDNNHNGLVESIELASNATLFVDSNRNGVLDGGEPTTLTQSDGRYTFVGLPLGDHAIRVQPSNSTHAVRTLRTESSLFALRVVNGVSTIFKHDAITGQVLRQFAAPGTSSLAAGMAINQHGLYYSSSGGIWRLNPDDGSVLDQWPTPGTLYDGLASVGGFLFALNTTSDLIVKFDPLSGQVITAFNINAINRTSFDLVGGLGESSSGTHLVVSVGSLGPLVLINPIDGTVAGNVNSSSTLAIAGAGGELFRSDGFSSILVENLIGTTPYAVRSVPVSYSALALAAATLTSKEYVVRSGYQSVYSTLDFQLVPPAQPGSAAGLVYRDDDGDGMQDLGELGLAGVQVYLDLNANGTRDLGDPNQLTAADDPSTTTIDESGQYLFTGLTPRQYFVRQEVPPPYQPTAPLTVIANTTQRYDSNFAFAGFQHHPDDDIRLSATGRYLVYATARQVLPADTNSRRDIYFVDRQTGTQELISINNSGVLGNANHFEPDISADGRFVTFRTGSVNLDARDTNGAHDIYIRDRQLGTTTLLTVPLTGSLGAGGHTADAVITPDGQHVLFYSAGANLRSDDTNAIRDTFVWNRSTGLFDRISLSSAGLQLTAGESYGGDMSADGRFVLFESTSNQISAADSNGVSDIYWKDRVSGEVRLVSASDSGTVGNDKSQKRSISDDGRWVAFDSFASNLTADPHPGSGLAAQVYLKDIQTGAIRRISLAAGAGTPTFNAQRPEISGDGRLVIFESDGDLLPSDSNGLVDVYLYDRLSDSLRLVSRGDGGATANGPSNNAVISSDGTTIAYTTAATNIRGANLVGGVVIADVLALIGVHAIDVSSGANLTNLDFGNVPAVGSISGTDFIDGNENGTLEATDRRVSGRTFYVDLNRNGQLDPGEPTAVSQVDDPGTGTDETGQYLINNVPSGQPQVRQVLPDGWQQTFPVPTTSVVSLASINNYQPGINNSFYPRFDSVLSREGRYVAFSTDSQLLPIDTNSFYDIYVLDRQTNDIELVSVTETGGLTNGFNFNPTISGDGRFVGFQSFGNNVVPIDNNGQADVFLRDRLLGTTVLISRAIDVPGRPAIPGNSYSYNPQLSGDGQFLTFWSAASDIVAGDTNGVFDLFSITLATRVIERISKGFDGSQAVGGNTHHGFMSYDGRYIAFQSHATNLVSNDINGSSDVFVYDRSTGLTERVSVLANGEPGNAESFSATISDDGRFVAFKSRSGNFVGSPTIVSHQILIKDRQTGALTLASSTESGGISSEFASQPAISGDGRWVVFDSTAANLAPGDTNGLRDVFLYDAVSDTTRLISRNASGLVGDGTSEYAAISRDGSTITFLSNAFNFANRTIGGLYQFDNSASIGSSPAAAVTVVTGQETVNVNFASQPVIAAPTVVNSTIAEGSSLQLDLANVIVPGGVVVSEWRIGWGDGAIDNFATRPDSPTHVYSSVGSKSITLTLLTSVGTITHGLAVEVDVASAPPTDISLSANSINENVDTSAADMLFATLAATDATTTDTHSFKLVPGSGDADNASFVIGGNQLNVRHGVTLDYETKPSYSVRILVTDAVGLSLEKVLTLTVNNLIEISKSNVQINGGAVQRSRVETVTVEFDTDVILQSGAITVTKRGAGGGLAGTVTSPLPGVAARKFTLTFSGAFAEFGSLADGNYELRVDATKIASVTGQGLDTNKDGVVGDDFVFGDTAADKFFRLFGDADGDRDTDLMDYVLFRRTFTLTNSSPQYLGYFNFDNDTDVDMIDYIYFRRRFGTSLTF